MKRAVFQRFFIYAFFLFFIFSSCAQAVVVTRMVTQVVTIVGRRAGGIALAEAIRYGMDVLFTAIFTDTASRSSDVYSENVIPFNNRPGYGHYRYDGEFDVKSGINGYDLGINKIKIPGESIIFKRTQFGTWELTSESRAMIKERVEVATAQQVLAGMNYNPGRVDGIVGKRTNSAVARLQKDNPQIFGNHPSNKLDYSTRQMLLTYQTRE